MTALLYLPFALALLIATGALVDTFRDPPLRSRPATARGQVNKTNQRGYVNAVEDKADSCAVMVGRPGTSLVRLWGRGV